MVITILEAHVPPEQSAALEQTFRASGAQLPPQMAETFLIRGTDDPTLWRGVSVWRSRQALDEYRRSVQTPGGVLMFRAVGAEPTLSIFDVVTHSANTP
jgi:heme-degrading monooxygenase HmoA